MKLNLADMARILGVENIHAGNVVPEKAQIDSRLVGKGDIFFCIPGERVDGHDFAIAAARAGASVIIAERDPFAGQDLAGISPPPVFVVENSVKALQKLAMRHRDDMRGIVVGITGTAGKTSVKEVLAQVLSVHGSTGRSPMNKNNSIGLPMSMLNADETDDFWVMEAGISQPGDMEELGEILRPDLALVLNVGEAHLDGLGKKGVAWHKSRLFNYVRENGSVFYNADYPALEKAVLDMSVSLAGRKVTVNAFSAKNKNAFCYAEYTGPVDGSNGSFQIFCNGGQFTTSAPFHGEMGCENVAAISALAIKAGLSPQNITTGLASAELPGQRFAISRKNGYTIVDDSYNANPLSSRRMLEVVGEMAKKDGLPLVLVMGEMGELGEAAEEAHKTLGRQMAAQNPALVFWKGGHENHVALGVKTASAVVPFYRISSAEEFIDKFTNLAPKNALVFFKGSRMNHLEELVNTFNRR